jgi:hypothetical protein
LDGLSSPERAYRAAVDAARTSAPDGRPLEPIPVRTPAGDVESWFVPVAVGDSLIGYVRVGRGGPSYSQFGQPQPRAAWTDPAAVAGHVERSGNAVGGTPYLGYDGAPSRLAWVVPLAAGGVAYVAGATVWMAPAGDDTT